MSKFVIATWVHRLPAVDTGVIQHFTINYSAPFCHFLCINYALLTSWTRWEIRFLLTE